MVKNVLLLWVLLLIGFSAKSQCDKVYITVDRKAAFEGGPAAWKRFVEREILSAFDDATEEEWFYLGTLRMSFVINTKGKITQFRFLDIDERKPVIKYLNIIARKLTEKTGWKPAELNGQKVCFKHTQILILCRR